MTRILNHKPTHDYTEHDPLPPEVVINDPSIAYLSEDRSVDYSVVLPFLLNIEISRQASPIGWNLWFTECGEEHSFELAGWSACLCGQ